jgi:hypothetical protein
LALSSELADFSVRFFLPVVRPGKETAVCHHMVFQQAILKQLMSEVLWSSHWYWIYVSHVAFV